MATELKHEGAVYKAIEQRFPSPAWHVMRGVRDTAGFRAKRTADALAMSLWPSRGLELVGFEIKVSRGDWRRELADPAKAEQIAKYCDRWWVVAGSKRVVPDLSEVPAAWGLMIPHGKTLRIVKDAPKLESIDMDRGFIASLFREQSNRIDAVRRGLRDEVYAELQKTGDENAADDLKTARKERDVAREAYEKLSAELTAIQGAGIGRGDISIALRVYKAVAGWDGVAKQMLLARGACERASANLLAVAGAVDQVQELCAPLLEALNDKST